MVASAIILSYNGIGESANQEAINNYISDYGIITVSYTHLNIGSILFSDINRQCSSGWIKENAHDFINRRCV